VKTGQTAIYSLSVTGVPGISGMIALTCTGVPTGATCTINPASLNLASGKTSNFTVSVSTSGSSTSALVAKSSIAGFGFISILLPLFRSRKQLRAVRLAVLLLLACAGAAILSGCGGGQSSPSNTASSGVAPGTYALKITATKGTVSVTQNLSLTVQ
jgi:hypothetical protein